MGADDMDGFSDPSHDREQVFFVGDGTQYPDRNLRQQAPHLLRDGFSREMGDHDILDFRERLHFIQSRYLFDGSGCGEAGDIECRGLKIRIDFGIL